jgi:hypothetical protein
MTVSPWAILATLDRLDDVLGQAGVASHRFVGVPLKLRLPYLAGDEDRELDIPSVYARFAAILAAELPDLAPDDGLQAPAVELSTVVALLQRRASGCHLQREMWRQRLQVGPCIPMGIQHRYERLKVLAQILGRHGAFLTCT